MKVIHCPSCGARIKVTLRECPECGTLLTKEAINRSLAAESKVAGEWEQTLTFVFKVAVRILIALITLALIGYGIYKVHFWRKNLSLQKLYDNGTMQMPTLDTCTFTDGRYGHSLTFYGEDGDSIYIEELQERYMIIGGKAVVEEADATWFEKLNSNASGVQVSLTPVLNKKDGEKVLLPIVSFAIDMPYSPLDISSPATDYVDTFSSTYAIKMNVVYGSTVLVAGEDVTSMVDKQGNLDVTVAISPIGENPVSILVKTPNHIETRRDLVFYRAPMDIDISVASGTQLSTVLNAMTIRGTVESDATLSVASPYDDTSFEVDENGNFSFLAKFDHYGYNTIRIEASREGDQDSVLEFEVYYCPTITEYSGKAWKMDYQQLIYCWQEWYGRVFLCRGTIVHINDDGSCVIDVSDDRRGNYLTIENMTGMELEEGARYNLYADVDGQGKYEGKVYTNLVARFGEKLDS